MGFKKPDTQNPERIVKAPFNNRGRKKNLKKIPNATEDWSYYKKRLKKM